MARDACSITNGARGAIARAAGTVQTWAGVSTCNKRARVPIGRGVPYVYNSTRVIRAVVYGYYACIVTQVWSVL